MLQPNLEKRYCEMRVWAASIRDSWYIPQYITSLASILISALNNYDEFKHSAILKEHLWQTCEELEELIKQEIAKLNPK